MKRRTVFKLMAGAALYIPASRLDFGVPKRALVVPEPATIITEIPVKIQILEKNGQLPRWDVQYTVVRLAPDQALSADVRRAWNEWAVKYEEARFMLKRQGDHA